MQPGTPEWLGLVTEEIVDPDIEIVDPHHHLWPPGGRLFGDYGLDDLCADTGSGPNVVQTAFVESHASSRPDGPHHLRPISATEYVAEQAAALRSRTSPAAPIAGIVAHADLRDGDRLDEVLDAHTDAGQGLFRGIRHAGSCADEPDALMIAGRAPAGLYADDDFRAGARHLATRGLTYDTWHYHHQNADFAEFCRTVPDTRIVLDHLGTPVGVGKWAGRHDEIFETWRDDIAAIARCDNVVAKLGGMAMPDNGFGWHTADRPPTSDEFAEAQRRWHLHMIECFGPERCMFERNFPADKLSVSYPVMWNGLKKIVADFSPTEKSAMFSGTATRVYGL